MSTNEMQHWLDRNRPPRVQITYDVETLGSPVKQEIPFIVGVIGDFAGGDRTAGSPIAERGFVEIDRDNFAQVMATLKPQLNLGTRLPFRVSRTPEGDTYETDPGAEPFAVSLSFTRMDDFAPPAIIEQIPLLKAQMQTRRGLRDLLAKLGTAPDLDKKLREPAAAPTLQVAHTTLSEANMTLMTAGSGASAAFEEAAKTVVAAETDVAGQEPVKAAQAAVTAAVGGFVQAFKAAGAGTAADVSAAGDAAWRVAAALRDGMQVLSRTSSDYSSGNDKQKAAIPLVEAAGTAVDQFVALAGTAAVQGASALALNPNTTPAQTPPPPSPPAQKA